MNHFSSGPRTFSIFVFTVLLTVKKNVAVIVALV